MTLIDCAKIRDGLDRSSTAHDRLMTTGTARAMTRVDGQIAENARYQFAVVLSAGGLAACDSFRRTPLGAPLAGRQLIPTLLDIDPFHRGAFCRQSGARCAAVRDTASDARRRWRQKAPGPLGWGTSVRRVRCGACPMSRIAPRAAPARRADVPHEMGQYQGSFVLTFLRSPTL